MNPRIGIRPVIDGRQFGIRESLEVQTMNMAKSAKELIESSLRYPDGTPVECVIGPCTIGGGADRLIASSRMYPSKALALDAAASALTEALCNRLNAELREQAAAEGKFLRPRYSAGFGDFTLEYQKYFVDILNSPKNIGVALRNGTMMFPTKSVSALIGISDKERKQQ